MIELHCLINAQRAAPGSFLADVAGRENGFMGLEYECSAGKCQGKMTSREHTPTTRPMAARVQHIGFLGTYNDVGAKADAMALVGEQSIRYDAALRLLVAA